MIKYNPQFKSDGTQNGALTSAPSDSIIFDVPGKCIWVKGVKLATSHTYTFSHDNYITLTNTPGEPEDILIGVNTTALKNAIDTTYGIVNASTNGLAPMFSTANKATANAATTYNFLGIAGSTLKWYQLPWRNVRINSDSTDKLGVNSTDPLIISQGTGISVTWDSTNKKIVISNTAPDQDHNTDRTGIKKDTVSGTKKTDTTLIVANSSSGLIFEGGTNLFKIGDGTNYVEIPITPSFTVTDKAASILTSATTLATINGTDITAKVTVVDSSPTLTTSLQTIATIAGVEIKAKITNYNTDENVKQTPKTDNVNRPLMMINGSTSSGELTSTSMFSTGIYANASSKTITANGFIKNGYDDTSVLLAGGGVKALTDFAMADAYVKKIGDTMTGSLAFNTTSTNHIEFTSSTYYTGGASEHTSIGYGRFQCWGQIRINADTDESKSEYCLITSGRGVSDSTADGLAVGYNTLTWLNNTIWHAGNDGSGSGLDADLLDGTHKADLLTAASLGASGNSTILSVTVGGTTKTGSVTVPYATSAGNADTVDSYHKTDLIGNLTKNSWNPRGTNLAMDWYYNGGDMSISESGGQISVSIDGYFYQNEGRYRVTDVTETVTALGTSGNYLTWTKNGTTNNITVPYAILAGTVTVNNSDSNSTYRMVWHSGNTLYSTGGIYCNPSTDCIYASHYYETSDRAKKTNIEYFSEHIRKFTLKASGKTAYGVIAQEVAEMFREGEDGNMTVNYSSVLSYYIGALENRIKVLEDEINKLKNK